MLSFPSNRSHLALITPHSHPRLPLLSLFDLLFLVFISSVHARSSTFTHQSPHSLTDMYK